MKRLIGIIVTAFAVSALAATLAAAASLSLTSTSLSAGNASVTSCGVSSLTATRAVDSSGNVSQVTVTGIPQACSGSTLDLTLQAQDGSALTSSTATVGSCTGGCSIDFSYAGTISATNLYGYAFALR
ncbi:MAG: hypothetical protein ACRDLK_06350 [Gaiellaceae bacterium]